jgi:hypothetical protein
MKRKHNPVPAERLERLWEAEEALRRIEMRERFGRPHEIAPGVCDYSCVPTEETIAARAATREALKAELGPDDYALVERVVAANDLAVVLDALYPRPPRDWKTAAERASDAEWEAEQLANTISLDERRQSKTASPAARSDPLDADSL